MGIYITSSGARVLNKCFVTVTWATILNFYLAITLFVHPDLCQKCWSLANVTADAIVCFVDNYFKDSQ